MVASSKTKPIPSESEVRGLLAALGWSVVPTASLEAKSSPVKAKAGEAFIASLAEKREARLADPRYHACPKCGDPTMRTYGPQVKANRTDKKGSALCKSCFYMGKKSR